MFSNRIMVCFTLVLHIRKFDKDGDGYLDWSEFSEVGVFESKALL